MKNKKKLPLNIQLFADNEPVTQTDGNIEETGTTPVSKNENVEVKTFTQEEVNAILLKERKKIPSKEELQQFNEWKESQKTEEEKKTELTQKMTDTANENISLRQENQVLKSGVNADDADYVLFKVSKMEGEFEDNLKDFLKNNPKYLQKNEKNDSANTTGFSQNNTSQPKSEAQAYLDKKYANNPYYKQK